MTQHYRPSFYNFIYRLNGETWLFNSLNLGLIEIDEEIENVIQKQEITIDDYEGELKESLLELAEDGFIIPPYVNELKTLRYIYNTDRFNKDYLTITILPTLACNCSCYYCFERKHNKNVHNDSHTISDDFDKYLLQFIESKLPNVKSLSVAWFGGEPLLKFEYIEILSKKIISLCQKYSVSYTASITTNGYFITEIPDIVSRMSACKIDSCQITLDGAPKDHNRIRKLKNNSSGTFEKMLQGIKLLFSNNLNVSVRINISKVNIKNLPVLFDILERNDLKSLKIYFGQLIDYSDDDCSDLYLNTEEFAREVEKLYDTLRHKGFKYGLDDHYPTNARACIANRIDTAVIDCYGNIYKCRSQIGENDKTIGSIYNPENQTMEEAAREINWIDWTPFIYEKCKDCKYLPLCMGGCPYSLYDNDDALPICDEWKYNLDYFVKQKIMNLEDTADED